MEEGSKGGEICSKLFNLIPNGTDKVWKIQGCNVERSGHGVSEEEKLELRLAPPGGEAWQVAVKKEEQPVRSLLPLGYLSKVPKNTSTDASSEAKRVFLGALEAATEGFQQQQQSEFLQLKAKGKDLPQNTGGKEQQCLERRACDPSALQSSTARNATTPINAQTRTAAGPVVGWPPIRSFRKNLSSTSKSSPEPQNGSASGKMQENNMMGAFVKINMDGIPIGRKVDLKAYDSYDKLSLAVDQLFRGLLAAQKDPLAAGSQNIGQGKHVITGVLDGSGEYTLVYEDDEGDRMLVGDVPWDMFVSTAKRLRLLKSSDLTASPLGAISRKRMANDG